jgi:hypothetical protein
MTTVGRFATNFSTYASVQSLYFWLGETFLQSSCAIGKPFVLTSVPMKLSNLVPDGPQG